MSQETSVESEASTKTSDENQITESFTTVYNNYQRLSEKAAKINATKALLKQAILECLVEERAERCSLIEFQPTGNPFICWERLRPYIRSNYVRIIHEISDWFRTETQKDLEPEGFLLKEDGISLEIQTFTIKLKTELIEMKSYDKSTEFAQAPAFIRDISVRLAELGLDHQRIEVPQNPNDKFFYIDACRIIAKQDTAIFLMKISIAMRKKDPEAQRQ